MRVAKLGFLIMSFVFCGAALGCSGKVNKESYDKIANGMTSKEVETILGPGTEQASTAFSVPSPAVAIPGQPAGVPGMVGGAVSAKVLMWHSGGKAITVTFINDKVAAKSQVGL